ncbi:MAG: Rrf2 family transcriptional regulator [Synergistaceae bacterium]|nr:Rrf2 family transcriptional regulator [Synergistaceae bacterium]
MLLTKECDYGIRIVRGLSDGLKKSVVKLCEIENIPRQYAYKILKKLEHSGIVKSYRGPSGGYMLEKSLHELSLLSIVTSIEDDVLILECMKKGYICAQNMPNYQCSVHKEMLRLQGVLMAAMAERSMEEIIQGGDIRAEM